LRKYVPAALQIGSAKQHTAYIEKCFLLQYFCTFSYQHKFCCCYV